METKGFTLIEILVVIGVTMMLMLVVGGVMTSSFKSKNMTDSLVETTTESQMVMSKLKDNILDAKINSILCTIGVGNSVSFFTKSGGQTTLVCDEMEGRIASTSAKNGTFWLSSDKVKATDCDNFVQCSFDGQMVTKVDFIFTINNVKFVSEVIPR